MRPVICNFVVVVIKVIVAETPKARVLLFLAL